MNEDLSKQAGPRVPGYRWKGLRYIRKSNPWIRIRSHRMHWYNTAMAAAAAVLVAVVEGVDVDVVAAAA